MTPAHGLEYCRPKLEFQFDFTWMDRRAHTSGSAAGIELAPAVTRRVVGVMFQLAYVSTFALKLQEKEIDDILAVSRRNNHREGITGLLIADGIRFLQVLEGDQVALEKTFARISNDPRHFAIFTLVKRLIGAREFGDWAMAYQSVQSAAEGLNLAEKIEAMTIQLADGEVKDRLRHFLRIDRQVL